MAFFSCVREDPPPHFFWTPVFLWPFWLFFCRVNLTFKGMKMQSFEYEITPTMVLEDGITKCADSEADQWSVYERPLQGDEHGHCLAVWVADFARKEDAQAFVSLFEDTPPQKK